MIFLDASAVVAISVLEPDAATLAQRVDAADRCFTSPLAVYEAVLGVARIRQTTVAIAQTVIDGFIQRTPVEIIPITAEIGRLAIDAFARFGRGNHPARLNMGDCFAYACARSLGVPLLAKGGDFPQTDIALA